MSFHKKFCNWATQKNIKINKLAYKKAENAFIDTLACILSGVKEQQSKIALKYCKESNNFGKVKIFGGGKNLSASSASFLHGVRAAAIDYDDYEYIAGSHPSAPIYSALISISQIKKISLKEVYEGWVVGYELIIKLGQALSYDHYYKGWHSANTIGVIGTSAAVSRVLKLNSNQMTNAISIATSFASGLKEQFGKDTKAFHIGFAAQGGLQSALLAKNDGTANQDIWNVERGFLDLYGTKLSKKFNNSFKKKNFGNAVIKYPNFVKYWPVCSYSQRVIQGGLILNKKIKLKNKIKHIKIEFPEPWYRVSKFHIPKNSTEARFSLSYCLAISLLNGKFNLNSLNINKNKKSLNLIKKIKLETYRVPKNFEDYNPKYPDIITVFLKDKSIFKEKVFDIKGGKNNPISDEDIRNKFLMCGGDLNILNKIIDNNNINKKFNTLIF